VLECGRYADSLRFHPLAKLCLVNTDCTARTVKLEPWQNASVDQAVNGHRADCEQFRRFLHG
jgi:hypothetical protein